VIHSGVKGQVNGEVSDMPWHELLENVLASNGLGFVLDDNLLFIARVEDLGAIERVRGRTYRGQRSRSIFSTATFSACSVRSRTLPVSSW